MITFYVLINFKMKFENFWEEISVIWGTENRLILPNSWDFSSLPKWVMDFIDETREIIDWTTNLSQLERQLIAHYWSKGRKVYSPEGIRCSNVFAFPETAVPRREEDLIIPDWETHVEEIDNKGDNIKDPQGWMSINPAPTPWYWSMGKIPELRPMNLQGFNKDFHRDVMNAWIQFEEKWVALERNTDWEIAVMPLIAMQQSESNSAIQSLLEKYPDIPDLIWTAKYQWINS